MQPRVAIGTFLAAVGVVSLLPALAMLWTARANQSPGTRAYSARYFTKVIVVVGLIQAALALAPAVVALSSSYGDSSGQRAILLAPLCLGVVLCYATIRHLKCHPSQLDMGKAPRGPAA
jgi:hypothetical protein